MTSQTNSVTVDLGEIHASCFVIMPFSPIYQTTYERVLRPAVEDANLDCIRADEVFTKAQVSHEIWKQICECRLVIAELTGKNPNVLYELGLAHALGKPAIIITRNQDDVPFDLKALRYLYYDINDPFWGETLRHQLTEMCRKVIDQQDFTPVFEGIVFQGKKTVRRKTESPRREIPVFNLSGVWHGNVRFSDRSDEYSWNLHLVHTANELTGTLVVSYERDNQLTVVQQSISGEISGNRISLHGTSYSFLQRGSENTYFPDRFSGHVTQNGAAIEGTAIDDIGSGELVLTLTTIERDDG